MLWNLRKYKLEEVAGTLSWQLVKFNLNNGRFIVFLLNVYGPTKKLGKWESWSQLVEIIDMLRDEKVVVIGYFNATINISEKKGGSTWKN